MNEQSHRPKKRKPRTVSRRTFLKMVGAGASAGLLAACAGPQAGRPGAPAAPTATVEAVPTAEAVMGIEAGFMRPEGTPKRGGILRTAFGVTMAHFDAHQGGGAHVLCHMYNNLVRLNLVDGLRTVIPDLALSWEISEDGKAYTFQLREGVKYHDGTPFSADDVVATFNRIINPPEGIVSTLKADLGMVDSVEALDKMTVRFNLNAPRPYFINLLTQTAYVIYSKKSLEENNYDLREVVAPGTGAFKYVEYKTAERWVMERNPDYWDPELPYVDGLELIHVPAWSDRGTAVLTGQADMSWNVAFETWVEGQKRPEEVGVNKFPSFGAYVVVLNNEKAPLDDPRVRRAIHLAVSKQDLIQAFATQEQINLTRWVPHGDAYATPQEIILTLPGYRPDKTEDIETAKALLAEAGYPDGIQGVELLAAAGPQAELLAPAFQDQLKRSLGIESNIRIIERALLKQEQQAGNYQMVLDTYGHGLSDISPRANLWWRTGGSQNFSRYSNPEFDALLDQIDVELDPERRGQLIAQAQDVLDENPPWYLIGYTFHLPMWRNYVKGLALDKRAHVEWGRVETVWLDK